ncbi:MAG: porin [Pirellulales bacterium]|nr:porin [Pirellulales bacterium]
MRTVKWMMIGSLLGVVLTGVATANEGWASGVRQPSSVQQTAFDYDPHLYFSAQDQASESPSDVTEVAPADTGCVADSGDVCAPSCAPSCRRCRSGCCGCDLGDPWTLPQPCFLQSRGIEVGGWVSAGLFTNSLGATDNGPLGFNNVGDGFTMNQLWVYVEKATDTRGYGADIGFRFDYVFGVDGPDTQSFGDEGWDFNWNPNSRDYGSAIPQLYVELAVNDLTVKLGHFYTLIGWEVVTAPDNFFYTHSYTMYYAEPFTHTGGLASWAVNDNVTVHGGWTMGWDSGWENLNDASTFLGGVSFALSDRTSLTWALTSGDFGAGKNGLSEGDIYMNSIVLEHQLTQRLSYILQHDLGVNSNLPGGDNEWYGVNQYLVYQLNDRWAGGLRFEWFRDDNGARVIQGNAGDYYELTAGLNYKPHANVMLRPEIRFDWYDGGVGGGRPFGNGTRNEQFSGGFDCIVTF